MTQNRSRSTRRAEATAASERAAAIRQEQERRERRHRTVVVAAIVAVVIALVVAIGYALKPSDGSATGTAGGPATAPHGVVAGDAYAIPYGQASAPVRVEIYEDFLCPICGEFEKASGPLLRQYVDQGKVRIEYRVISILDRASNGTEYSTRAANAAAVVLDTAGPAAFKKFHDLLYANQPPEGSSGLADPQLVDLAVQAGAPRAQVTKGIRDRAFEPWVSNATAAASQRDGFQGTPAIYVDGKQLTGYSSIEELQTKLRQAIDTASAG
jgi:protein-disulfide isomerase